MAPAPDLDDAVRRCPTICAVTSVTVASTPPIPSGAVSSGTTTRATVEAILEAAMEDPALLGARDLEQVLTELALAALRAG